MRQTSILAYGMLDKEKLNNKQREVYEAIEDLYPCSDKDIAKHLNWPINSVTPRRGELYKKHRIIADYVARDYTGRMVTFWKPRDGRGEMTYENY